MTRLDRVYAEVFASTLLAADRFRVALQAASVDVLSSGDDIKKILDHTFGAQADVMAVSRSEPATGWTVAVLAMKTYDDVRALFAEQGERRTGGAKLANYWRDDFAATPLDLSSERAAVHHCDPFEGLTLFAHDRKLIVYVHAPDPPFYVPHFEHLVAYALRFGCWHDRCVDVHAAFVRYRGKGVALLGKRRAGKTSLAMHLLQRGGDLLGSDMAELHIYAGDKLVARAIPHMCRITPETVWDNALLAGRIGSAYDRNTDYLSAPLFSHGKYELYGPSLDQVFGRPVCIASMELAALLFPHFSLQQTKQAIHRVPDADGKERLLSSIEHDRPLADWLPFDVSCRTRTEIAMRDNLEGKDAPFKCYDFHFGKEGSLSWDDIDAAFDSI
jgi:hypothetical protein